MPTADYKRETYYICCGGCIGQFQKDPEKYIQDTSVLAYGLLEKPVKLLF